LHASTTAQDDFHQKILMLERGSLPMISLALRAQAAGAMALIIVDDGRCSEYDQACIPGASKTHGQGFARLDGTKDWHTIKIPVLFVKKDYGTEIAAVSCPTIEGATPASTDTKREL
jgi:hypothetical protein